MFNSSAKNATPTFDITGTFCLSNEGKSLFTGLKGKVNVVELAYTRECFKMIIPVVALCFQTLSNKTSIILKRLIYIYSLGHETKMISRKDLLSLKALTACNTSNTIAKPM